ncbi:MAG: gluconate 2-dehydrogenase subunit 3 family protein [Holophagales bacterium]|nr:gluconate 2-dehydrogenase subunit 3 family protein [Holophagales bacterium]MYG29465.1 gluconate 2-dehydrogenase subunit 3 family protein [Holophagales bacterium]MYI80017.1 gluconate 2-dehydrogenase subunit 3 family protein [Holophagales bacterium]
MTRSPWEEPAETLGRRRALQVIGGAAALPFLPTELFANPHRAHLHLHAPQPTGGEPQPLAVLTEHQAQALDAIAERILPATDTPGAGDAGIPAFVDRLLEGWLPDAARDHLLVELDRFDNRAREHNPEAAGFVDLESAAQDELLTEAQDEAIAQRDGRAFSRNVNRLHEQPFFDLVKWLTLFGYYTSEAGMKSELGYRIVPGRWDPCVDIEDD